MAEEESDSTVEVAEFDVYNRRHEKLEGIRHFRMLFDATVENLRREADARTRGVSKVHRLHMRVRVAVSLPPSRILLSFCVRPL